jgi:hypothetical protein
VVAPKSVTMVAITNALAKTPPVMTLDANPILRVLGMAVAYLRIGTFFTK